MTTTTIVEVGHPPVPHRELPDTGTSGLLLPSAGLCVVVGLVLAVVARKRRRKRYYVIRTNGNRFAVVTDLSWVKTYANKQAAKNRAAVLNANVPSLADSKGWKA